LIVSDRIGSFLLESCRSPGTGLLPEWARSLISRCLCSCLHHATTTLSRVIRQRYALKPSANDMPDCEAMSCVLRDFVQPAGRQPARERGLRTSPPVAPPEAEGMARASRFPDTAFIVDICSGKTISIWATGKALPRRACRSGSRTAFAYQRSAQPRPCCCLSSHARPTIDRRTPLIALRASNFLSSPLRTVRGAAPRSVGMGVRPPVSGSVLTV